VDKNSVITALRASAEPTRFRLLNLCARGELTVSEITQVLAQSQPRVSRHLKLLCDAGFLNRVREGSWVFYRLTDDAEKRGLARMLVNLVPEDEPWLGRDRERLDAIKRARAARANEYFRANAGRWREIRSLYVDEAEVESALLRLVLGQEKRGSGELSDFLDVGTGTGRMLEIFGPHVRRGVGVDLSHEMLALARANLERAGLENCLVRHADMYDLPWDDASFDVAMFHQVLHYAEDPEAAIAEAARVLKPGGTLVVVDFAPHELEYLRQEHAHRRLGFAESDVAGWFAASGLKSKPALTLPGTPLTVKIWRAQKPKAPGRPRT
jgi:ArsR family transcriptional regulator